jgi:hypothetical protein
MVIDMAMLITEIKPDADGNVIPPSVQEGSASFANAKGRNEKITLVLAAGIYNVSNATCGGGCITCCGDSNFGISPNPIYCPIGQTLSLSSTAVDCYGYEVYPSSWSSSNTAVMTVDGSGNVNGVSAGSATITANFQYVTVYNGQICGGQSCPTASPAPSATAYVGPYRAEPIATASQFTVTCTIQGRNGPGWERNVTNQLQYSNGSPYAHAGITVADNFSLGRNDLGSGPPQSGSFTTTGDGSWPDTYYVCSTACPASTGETDALQNWTANGFPLPHVNTVIYKCNSITIDGF